MLYLNVGIEHVHDIIQTAYWNGAIVSLNPRGTDVTQVVRSAGVALAWYLASSAAAAAVSSATGGAVPAPRPRKKYTALPFLLVAYALSRKDVKERTRCAPSCSAARRRRHARALYMEAEHDELDVFFYKYAILRPFLVVFFREVFDNLSKGQQPPGCVVVDGQASRLSRARRKYPIVRRRPFFIGVLSRPPQNRGGPRWEHDWVQLGTNTSGAFTSGKLVGSGTAPKTPMFAPS